MGVFGNYTVTMNHEAKLDKYPILNMDDLFAHLF